MIAPAQARSSHRQFPEENLMAQAPNPFASQAPIPGVANVIAVSSGKGGVGKSTIAVNLAVALSKRGLRVGLLDADIYGPSLARMMGALNQKPEIDADQKLVPIERFGIKMMSFGFLVEEELAVVWRGPMLFKAMDQFLRGVAWGELDALVVDLPPGTGDVHLSLAQKVPVAGAVAVSTPQNVALMDVKKAIDMWARLGVPLFGVIENMAWLEQDGQRLQLFPKGQLDAWLKEKGIPKLAEIPFYPSVGMSGETGMPVALGRPERPETQVFLELADQLRARLALSSAGVDGPAEPKP
jgi:ATP-binding protein involved in chromosome partitioning